MVSGTVKWFNNKKGFGFIEPDDKGPDVFIHISALHKAGLQTLNEGQKINFDLEENRGRTSAVNLEVL